MKQSSGSGIPLSQYHAEVVGGLKEPGDTGNLSKYEFIKALGRLNFSEETIRCGECFERENLGCPGMLWLGNLVMEETGETCLKLACPLDVAASEGEENVPGILFNLSEFKDKPNT